VSHPTVKRQDIELSELNLKRRAFLLGAGGTALASLAGCASTSQTVVYQDRPVRPVEPADTGPYPANVEAASLYGPKPDEQFPLPAIPYQKINPRYYRQMVENTTGQPPGTLVVDTGNHFLYYTYPNGQAMRYGVGLGREGFAWAGRGVIQYKRKWPRWVPPDEMIARQPELSPYQADLGGMPPGLTNPLGARALYIFSHKQDTQYRLHGSPEWWTIGKNVSSGCVRLINQDVVDLYDRVANKTPILVTNLNNPSADVAELQPDQAVNRPRQDDYRDPYQGDDRDELLGPADDDDDVSVW
jgi:lipoprotein-anchoring transpeptidase ErfK/SrfK